jgi:hypothetical protein
VLLHEAIAEVLRRNGNMPMHADDIAAEINRLGLYQKGDRTPLSRRQVVARMTKPEYRHLFERTSPGHYRLRRR